MAAQRPWGWDLEEMRSAGAMLDDHGRIIATEYGEDCSQPIFFRLMLN